MAGNFPYQARNVNRKKRLDSRRHFKKVEIQGVSGNDLGAAGIGKSASLIIGDVSSGGSVA
jgi:hypothetical protein